MSLTLTGWKWLYKGCIRWLGPSFLLRREDHIRRKEISFSLLTSTPSTVTVTVSSIKFITCRRILLSQAVDLLVPQSLLGSEMWRAWRIAGCVKCRRDSFSSRNVLLIALVLQHLDEKRSKGTWKHNKTKKKIKLLWNSSERTMPTPNLNSFSWQSNDSTLFYLYAPMATFRRIRYTTPSACLEYNSCFQVNLGNIFVFLERAM